MEYTLKITVGLPTVVPHHGSRRCTVEALNTLHMCQLAPKYTHSAGSAQILQIFQKLEV